MDVISRNILAQSGLNPNAPMFVPAVYKAVEDFSDEWWALVHSSPWFQDYWFQCCFEDTETTPPFSQIYDPVLSDLDSLLDDNKEEKEKKEGKDYNMNLVRPGALKWRHMRDLAETSPRFSEKVPKIVNKKVNPRPIQQPR